MFDFECFNFACIANLSIRSAKITKNGSLGN